jgi:cob(I)alamin adenosyltransferase
MSKLKCGLIHVYTGDGKGKTTAALGLALRAAGCGLRVYVCQFLKGQEYGELEAVQWLAAGAPVANVPEGDRRPPITIERFGRPTFVHVSADGTSSAGEEDVRLARAGLDAARRAMSGGQYDLVVLDEINVALYFRLLTVQEVLELIDARPEGVELVLTGRRVPDEILARADYVTEMREVRHPYQRGVQARKGIEF